MIARAFEKEKHPAKTKGPGDAHRARKRERESCCANSQAWLEMAWNKSSLQRWLRA